jgi:PIN domain nuclease of toxin-antitoxin system
VIAPILDTHAWVWWLHGETARLGRRTVDALDTLPAGSRPYVCDISLWEVATLVELGRLDLGEPLESWLGTATNAQAVQIAPISARVAAEVARLPSRFRRDPADRLIVATARVLDRPLLTKDDAIRRSGLTRLWSPTGQDAPRP